jgi:hypothetical protein
MLPVSDHRTRDKSRRDINVTLENPATGDPSWTGGRGSGSLRHPDRLFIGGRWVAPASQATILVTDSATEAEYLRVAEAQGEDIASAVASARTAFDEGPWPYLTHTQRAGYLRAIAAGLRERADDLADAWTRQSGVLYSLARHSAGDAAAAGRKIGFRLRPALVPLPGGVGP